jgi:hypothetical protein
VRTEGISIVAALALHAAFLLGARAMPRPVLVTSADLREIRPIDVEMAPMPPLEAPREPAPAAAVAVAPHAETERPPDRERPAARVAPGPEGPRPDDHPPETNPQPPPTAQGPTKFDDLPPEQRGGVLGVPGVPGLGGDAVWAMPGVIQGGTSAPAPAPTEAPKPRPVDRDIAGKVVREAMHDHDKTLGLDLPAGGTLASAVSEAVRASDVPDVSRGSIEFRIGPGGQVLGYRVLSQTAGGADAWDRMARAAAARVAGRLVLSGEYARGAVITIDVVSNVQAPSGSKGGFTSSGAAFDVSNIGAHATRAVRASFRVAAIR